VSPHQSAEPETTDATSSPTFEGAGPATGSGALDASPLDALETVTDLDVLALSTPLGVFRSTEADGIVWVNRRFLAITGLSRKQVLGHDWVRAIHPFDRQRIDAAPGPVREATRRFDPVPHRATGRRCASARPGAAGTRTARRADDVVGAMQDVTERADAPAHLAREAFRPGGVVAARRLLFGRRRADRT
jgi:PAS domain S-box-containing protein